VPVAVHFSLRGLRLDTGPQGAQLWLTVTIKGSSILVWMVLAIVALGAVALWDEQRESALALGDFAQDQASTARSVGSVLVARLAEAEGMARAAIDQPAAVLPSGMEARVRPASAPSPREGALAFRRAIPLGDARVLDVALPMAHLTAMATSLGERGSVVVLIKRPDEGSFVGVTPSTADVPALDAALARGASWLRLSRAEAAAVGLPARTAMAGLSTVDAGAMGKWGIAVVATALRERDREVRAEWRLGLGFALASGLVLAFGSLALRTQRKELALTRELAVAEAMSVRDERLVRADKLATLGALAAGIAHEVSTPLGVIVGRAEQLLPKVESDERAKRAVVVIGEQAERISRIVRAFLGLARGGTPSLEHVWPKELVASALELVEHRFTKADVHLASQLDDALPKIACDPRLFEQVLVNLLLNACDACAPGGHVELSVTRDGDRVVFVVTDDGAGITEESARRALEPFFTTKAQGQGTGLGLAIANEIVKHHHGELTLSPRDRAPGTRATVEIDAAGEGAHHG
jgi:two-component system, NtrC family, sensor kinase